MMKKNIVFLLLIITSVNFLSGCSLNKNTTNSINSTGLEQKNQEFSITGTLSQNGELFFVTDATGTIHDVETYSVSFEEYVGQTVTVSGQYSGNTIFVTEISN